MFGKLFFNAMCFLSIAISCSGSSQAASLERLPWASIRDKTCENIVQISEEKFIVLLADGWYRHKKSLFLYDKQNNTMKPFEENYMVLNPGQFYTLRRERDGFDKRIEILLCCKDLRQAFTLLDFDISKMDGEFGHWCSLLEKITYGPRHSSCDFYRSLSQKKQNVQGERARVFEGKDGIVLQIDYAKTIEEGVPGKALPFHGFPKRRHEDEFFTHSRLYDVFFSKNMFVIVDDCYLGSKKRVIVWRNTDSYIEPLCVTRLAIPAELSDCGNQLSVETSFDGDYVALFNKSIISLYSVEENESGVQLVHRLNLPYNAHFLKFSGDSIVFESRPKTEGRDNESDCPATGPGFYRGNIRSLITAYNGTIEGMYENNKTNYAAAKHEKIREPFNAIRLEFQRQYENFFQESEAIDQGIERLSTELSCAQVEESRLRESFYSDEVDPQKSELLQRSKEQEGYEEERVHLPQVLASKEQRALRPENNYELFEEEVRKKETAAQQELVRLHNVKERVDVVRRYKKLIDEKSTSIGLKIALAMGIAPEIDDLRRDDQQCEKRLPTGECFIHSYIPQGNIRKRMALQEAAQQRQIQGVLNSFNPMARHLLQQHIRAQQRMTRS